MTSLHDYLNSKLNEYNLPILNETEWKELNEKHSKNEIKEELANIIVDGQAKFPFRKISFNDMAEKFRSFCADDCINYYMHDVECMEKFSDYKYPYKDFGLFTIQLGHHYNDVSNYFMQAVRYQCAGYSREAPIDIWKDKEKLKNLNWTLWRMGTKELDMGAYRATFRLGSYVATQFKPHVAKAIYQATNSKNILDTSCGWGDRLAAFYASPNTEVYIGCDPNETTFEIYKLMCLTYERILTGQMPQMNVFDDAFECVGSKRVTIFKSPSEELNLSNIPIKFDCYFTSPPYFATELYNKGGQGEDLQSWKRYDTYELWRDNFFFLTLKNFSGMMSDDGIILMNIIDPVIKGKRYNVCDELVDFMKQDFHFLGQIGMKMKQRPKKSDTLSEFLQENFIENVWCFSKNKNYEFATKYKTLEQFME
jgi:hypothetical protein